MSLEKDTMMNSLKQTVIPILREKGFKGSFPHFYRKTEERADLLMFQFSMWGGVLYVEISKCPPEGYTNILGEFYPLNKMKVYLVTGGGLPLNRRRIGKSVNGMFEFNRDNTDQVALQIEEALTEAEEWWVSYPDWCKNNDTI
ncbi:DUF4304 domain-containing protein [Planomicrobium sp. CPCC 101079]|uniref:DUF4304 domain-containing protein n=1 Tax=Planomicrobium sp. CPCC 101079 TaxID=2599618 RepID=UPI0011B4BFC4|nr:DUF4304 domain-containing protein [Planomicrobium sp. CPCC 101079]TWT14320.1 DUF4304 domain-containing protein [Planomicrobium sp. CPCC 101079]